LASVGSRSSAVRSDAHQNAGDSAAARQRRQQDWTGFPGCLSWGECPTGCCRCRRAAAPGSVCWRIEGQRGKQQQAGTPQPRHGRQPTRARPKKDGEARRRNFPRPPGRAGTGRRPRHRAPRKPTRGPPPPRLPGATDGNHGGSTGTGGGPGSANAREQERRAAASNIPDSVSYFVSPNGPTTGPRRAPAIAQASHNFMERRLPGGIPDFPFRRPRGRPMYDNAVFLRLTNPTPPQTSPRDVEFRIY